MPAADDSLQAAADTPRRLVSLDVDRGLTIALMILVNNGMDSADTFAQLQHSWWNGLTLTDVVFPNFIFIMGSAVVLALRKPIREGRRLATLLPATMRRAVLLFLLGLVVNSYPLFGWTQLRVFGVLQRIAICYLAAVLVYWQARTTARVGLAGALLLLVWWGSMTLLPIPGIGMPGTAAPFFDIHLNLANRIDQLFTADLQSLLHTGRLHRGDRDPEGLLSTLPAIATALMGIIAGLIVSGPPARRTRGLLILGGTLLAMGLLWSVAVPINKNLWTGSFALVCGGLSSAALAVCHWAFDARDPDRRGRIAAAVCRGGQIFGTNAIVAYMVSELGRATLDHVTMGGVPLWIWLYGHTFGLGGSGKMQTLLFSLSFVGLCFVPNLLLWRRRVFVGL